MSLATDAPIGVRRRAPRLGPRRAHGTLVAVAIVAGLVVIRLVSDALLGGLRLPDVLADAVTLALSVLLEAFPFLVLGIALSVAVQELVSAGRLLALLPRTPLLRRAALSLCGAVLPVCECGNVPLARGLMRQGLTVPEAMTFLLAAPILNPVTIVTTWQAFGAEGPVLWWRIAGGFLIANLLGWLWSRHPDPTAALQPTFGASCSAHGHGGGAGGAGRSLGARLGEASGRFADEMTMMLPALVLGAVLAAAIQTLVPRGALLSLGGDPVLSVLALMALAFVVSICSNVDAFFMLAFGSAFLPGSIIAFLVFGAMIDVKMLALLRTTFTARALMLTAAVVALAAAAIGFGVNALG